MKSVFDLNIWIRHVRRPSGTFASVHLWEQIYEEKKEEKKRILTCRILKERDELEEENEDVKQETEEVEENEAIGLAKRKNKMNNKKKEN